MTILFANNASTTVAGSITAASTTVNLAAGTGIFFPQPIAGSGNYFCATFYDQATKTINEIVHVTNITGDTATIVRGQEGTTPRAWTSGDVFANLVTAGTLQAFVQSGVIAANTQLVYTGIDTSTDPHHIVCNTIPVPSAYNIGMVFTIKVGGSWSAGVNANLTPTDMALNGVAAVLIKRTDGSNLIAGNLIKNQEYLFMWNGTFFQSTFMPVPQQAPQTFFYVRADSLSTLDSNGIESNSGFANTPQDAFKTLQGAVNTIKNRYISQLGVDVFVADGTYTSGVYDNTQYIASWFFEGNASNPQNVVLDCRSTNQATYVPGAAAGYCVANELTSVITMDGFQFLSWNNNGTTGGILRFINCWFTAPTGSVSVLDCFGSMSVTGTNCHYSAVVACTAFAFAHVGGQLALGYHGPLAISPLTVQIQGSPTFNDAFFVCNAGGSGVVYDDVTTWVNGGANVNGRQYHVSNAGGIGFWSNPASLPGNTPGFCSTSAPNDCGGWIGG